MIEKDGGLFVLLQDDENEKSYTDDEFTTSIITQPAVLQVILDKAGILKKDGESNNSEQEGDDQGQKNDGNLLQLNEKDIEGPNFIENESEDVLYVKNQLYMSQNDGEDKDEMLEKH